MDVDLIGVTKGIVCLLASAPFSQVLERGAKGPGDLKRSLETPR